MKKAFLLFLILFASLLIAAPRANAQMMMGNNNTSSVNPADIQSQQQDEATGKKLFDQFQGNQITCQKLTSDNLEKIGEYSMGLMFGGNTAAHVAMNQRMQQTRGTTGEEQMHIQIGKSVTGCYVSSQNSTTGGGGFHMMGFGGYGYNGMMNGGFGWFSILVIIGWAVVLVDLILAGVWLWQQIGKNKKK